MNDEDFMKERAAEVAAMNDTANHGPFCGRGYSPVTDAQLAETLAGAEIVIDEDRFDGFVYMEGYLSAERGGHAFLAVKTCTPGSVHLLAVPGLACAAHG
ncbi:hypothetical protein AWB82_07070 [Caballeronia glebae]|uniref:Uncharacterized protein n=1 Tax=Caballeronia glebae TaxID=1777143 RepID=A0A158DQ93_9BURK|nr:hypothetical protein [Caballeronia glebae]SAK96774.1 hypothetical protein AWB82_07070 [Caballeronia glebae]